MKPRAAGDQRRMQFTLKDDGNDVVTTGSTFQLIVSTKRTGVRLFAQAMTAVSTSPKTVVYYDPSPTDVGTVGVYQVQIVETLGDGTKAIYPSDVPDELRIGVAL